MENSAVVSLQIARYEERIRELEDTVDSLRLSRRILMSLLEHAQKEGQSEIERLREENAFFRRKAIVLSRRLWDCQLRHNQVD